MPFDTTRPLAPEPGYVGVGRYDKPAPGWVETGLAALRQNGVIGSSISYLQSGGADFGRIDRNYNVYDDVSGYEDHLDSFDEVYNADAAAAVKARIDRERRDRQTLDAAGWGGTILSTGAALADPTIFIPGGALVKAAGLGYRVGRSALTVAGAAAVGTAVQEAGLQATQETRPLSESAISVGGSAILGGIFGAAASKLLTAGEFSRFGKALKEELADGTPAGDELVETIVSRARSAGAASVDELDLSDLGAAGPKVAQALIKATAAARANPGVSLMLSPSLRVRETYGRLANNPLYVSMNMVGESLGPAAENLVKQYRDGLLAQWLRSTKNDYRAAKKAGYQGTKREFYDAVSLAGRRGDIDPYGNAYVTKAAQNARATIYDPLLKRAQERGILPEDVSPRTATSYVSRLWKREVLIAKEQKFRQIATAYFKNAIASLPEDQAPDVISGADLDSYVEEVVSGVFNNLIGRGKGDVPEWIVPAKRGPMKERTFNISDELVEEFLENDSELILRRYARLMSADIELAEKFGRPDMRDQFDAIRLEYDELRAARPQEAAKLDAAERRDIRTLETFRDMMRGTFRAGEEGSEWSRMTRVALLWGFITKMGGLVKASLTDPARIIAVHGVTATMRQALPALVSNTKAIRIARDDARRLGVVAETVLQTRLATLSDLTDPYARGSLTERVISNASNIFAKATGISLWNDALRTIGSVMTTDRILRNALSYGSLSKEERAYMAFLGMNEGTAAQIAEQFARHGLEERGIHAANISAWDDDGAQRAFAAALAKDADRTIIQRDIGDVPIFTHTNTGKLVTQFMRFGMASHQKILLSGLQERPHRFAEGLLFATTLGMLTSYLSLMEVGNFEAADKLLDNPGSWIADGFDRSGFAFLLTEPWNRLDKVTSAYGGPNVGLRRVAGALAGDEDATGVSTRYASRNATGTILGPSAGTLEDMAKIIAAMTTADLNNERVKAILGNIPGATLPGVRSAVQIGVKPLLVDVPE